MNERIHVKHVPESGCWQVLRGTYVLAIFPKRMWHLAYIEARREAIYQNLGVVGIEVCS